MCFNNFSIAIVIKLTQSALLENHNNQQIIKKATLRVIRAFNLGLELFSFTFSGSKNYQ